MKKIIKKSLPKIFLLLLLIVLGGFFGELMAEAANVKTNLPRLSFEHCGIDSSAGNKEIREAFPASKAAMLPCCVERHDNSGTIIPNTLQERVKFSQALMVGQVACATKAVEQKIYPSSPSPPFQAENISSTIKIE